MSQFLLFSDIHIHNHKRSTDRLNDCIECLEWVFKTAIDKGIKHVLFLGDLFHDRQKIDVLTYQKAFEVFERYLGNEGGPAAKPPFELWLLLGNHDLWHRTDAGNADPLVGDPGASRSSGTHGDLRREEIRFGLVL